MKARNGRFYPGALGSFNTAFEIRDHSFKYSGLKVATVCMFSIEHFIFT